MNTYTKLKNGSWGVRVSGTASKGETVSVQTKSGATKSEIISAVLWTGTDKFTGAQISLCAVAQRSSNGYHRSGKRLLRSGEEDNGCWECRRLGHYCPRCAFDEYDN